MISSQAKRRIRKVVLWTEIGFILILGAGMGIVLGALYQMNKLLPPDSQIEAYRAPVGTTIYSSDGVMLARLAAENRKPVSLDRIPKHMQQAIVAIEDSRFFNHGGLDFRGLSRSLWVNISGGEMAQGGSTITQQLARNMFLSPKKTVSRKMKEMLLAIQIERNWTKKQILERYLNQVYFGSGAYGVETAARTYFNKKIEDITVPEAAMLAGLVQVPSRLSPYISMREDGNYDRTRARRDLVLARMVDLKFLTPEEGKKAADAPIKVARERPRTVGIFRAPHFVLFVLDQLRERYGYEQELIEKSGLTVITSLNYKMQKVAEQAAEEEVARRRSSHNVSEAALVSIDPHTGYIRAMVGSVNKPWMKYEFNCAVQARRQPGSAFKTFVYAAALEQGDGPYSSVNANASIQIPGSEVWQPKNHGKYSGSLSYVSAFAGSVNGAAANVAVKHGIFAGPRMVKNVAERLGIRGNLQAYPSIALGTFEVTVLDMASAYGVFPAGGRRAEPECILQIRSQDGEVIEDDRPSVSEPLLKSSTVEGMNILTRAVVTGGTARQASAVPGAHGKTGTTEDYTDAWFCGYTADLATAVWCGNRNNARMRRTYGSTIAVPIWTRFMAEAVRLNPAKKRPPLIARAAPPPRARRRRVAPPTFAGDSSSRNVIRVSVCTETGLLASPGCPSRATETYLIGQQPIMRCPNHPGEAPPAPEPAAVPAGPEAADKPGQEVG